MYVTRKVGPKGQVVIPEELRAQFDIHPGTSVSFNSNDEAIIIVRQKSAEQVLDAFHAIRDAPSIRKAPTIKEMKRWFEEEIEERNGIR
ncbi:MAG: AbrB/MazE/SpoVT family DNA-binding domain-containing protein [Candidatus Micrarchaeia archaeon]